MINTEFSCQIVQQNTRQETKPVDFQKMFLEFEKIKKNQAQNSIKKEEATKVEKVLTKRDLMIEDLATKIRLKKRELKQL